MTNDIGTIGSARAFSLRPHVKGGGGKGKKGGAPSVSAVPSQLGGQYITVYDLFFSGVSHFLFVSAPAVHKSPIR